MSFSAEGLLRSLQIKGRVQLDWRKTAKKLRKALAHHIEGEETVLFPKAQSLLTAQEAEMMGEAFLKLKPQIKEEGIAETTLELAANLMPARFATYMKSYNLEKRI
jgi:hemerythrin-like domain-containing protein